MSPNRPTAATVLATIRASSHGAPTRRGIRSSGAVSRSRRPPGAGGKGFRTRAERWSTTIASDRCRAGPEPIWPAPSSPARPPVSSLRGSAPRSSAGPRSSPSSAEPLRPSRSPVRRRCRVRSRWPGPRWRSSRRGPAGRRRRPAGAASMRSVRARPVLLAQPVDVVDQVVDAALEAELVVELGVEGDGDAVGGGHRPALLLGALDEHVVGARGSCPATRKPPSERLELAGLRAPRDGCRARAPRRGPSTGRLGRTRSSVASIGPNTTSLTRSSSAISSTWAAARSSRPRPRAGAAAGESSASTLGPGLAAELDDLAHGGHVAEQLRRRAARPRGQPARKTERRARVRARRRPRGAARGAR